MQTVLLGSEVAVTDGIELAPYLEGLPLGVVLIGFGGGSDLTVKSTSPSALYAVAKAFVAAAGRLKRINENSASVKRPGAEVRGDAGVIPGTGERPGYPAVTGSAGEATPLGDPVAAPPPSPTGGAL